MSFTLNIFKSELEEIEDFVRAYPNIETGGDLFGLWKANGHPVVQLIIGPGYKCRRTSVSFHQDTDYLARVGTYVNSSFMLCHIGSWHSHHQLSLTKPSAGDRSTVCNNFPQGLKRYIMIIANISRGRSVHIHPFMFSSGGHVCQQGDVKVISAYSPFREDPYVLRLMDKGAEKLISGKARSERAPPEYHKRPSTRSKPITGTSFQMNSGDSPTQPSITIPGHGYQHTMCQNYMSGMSTADDPTPMDVCPPDYQGAGGTENHMEVEQDNNQETQWYEREEGGSILKEIHGKVEHEMAGRDICYDRETLSKDLKMEFFHNCQRWRVEFPKSFNNKPAKVKNCSNGKSFLSTNIIRDIKRACYCLQCQKHEKIELQHSSNEGHPKQPRQRHGNLAHSHTRQDNYPSAKQNPAITSKNVQQTFHSRQYSSQSPSTPGHHISPRKQAAHKILPTVQGQQSRREPYSHCQTKRSPRKQESASTRSASRYGLNTRPGSSSRVPPSAEDMFFKSEIGEKKLKDICEKFSNLLLEGKAVSITRNTETKDVLVTFKHNKKQWRITFPFTFPDGQPTLEYAFVHRTVGNFHKVNVPIRGDLLCAVRQNCNVNCSSCLRYQR